MPKKTVRELSDKDLFKVASVILPQFFTQIALNFLELTEQDVDFIHSNIFTIYW